MIPVGRGIVCTGIKTRIRMVTKIYRYILGKCRLYYEVRSKSDDITIEKRSYNGHTHTHHTPRFKFKLRVHYTRDHKSYIM